jgi:hypothetical protein
MNDPDPYFKLRPPAPTPEEEICQCQGSPPIKLMYALGYNPVNCMNCNLEVPPESLQLPSSTVEAIAFWRSMYDAIYRLWPDSGEYETWAQEQLEDTSSSINRSGREVQSILDNVRRCYYWHFRDQSGDEYLPPDTCPYCGEMLTRYDKGIFE